MFQTWFLLFLAIIIEVAATLTMDACGHTGHLWMYALMYVFIASSYFLLSFTLRQMPVGIAIAIWEGFGTALISTISMLFLHEKASPQKILGIGLAIVGIILLHFGEEKEQTIDTL